MSGRMRKVLTVATTMLAAGSLAAGCMTPISPTPARLSNPDAANIARVRTVLAGALGRTNIQLGAIDWANSNVIVVLPPALAPQDGRSLATPIYFDVLMRGTACFARHRTDGREYPLQNISCVALTSDR